MKKALMIGAAVLLAAALFVGCEDGSDDSDDYDYSYSSSSYTYYTVTYDANGGVTGASDSREYTAGQTVTVATTYDFSTYKTSGSGKFALDSWNTKADGSGTTYRAGDTFAITADTTLYAQWNAHYVGEKVTATDVFGNSVTGYVAYIKPTGATSFTTSYTSGFSTNSTTYTVANAGGKNWKYLVAVVDGTTSTTSYKYKNRAWAPNGDTAVSGLSEDIGAGKANSDAIIAAYSDATTANCVAKALEEADKCYLPSVGEMTAIFQNLFYNGKITPPTYATGVLGSVSYYYTSNQAADKSDTTEDEAKTDALAFDLYKSSLAGGKSVSHTKTVAENDAWFVCTLGVTYLAE